MIWLFLLGWLISGMGAFIFVLWIYGDLQEPLDKDDIVVALFFIVFGLVTAVTVILVETYISLERRDPLQTVATWINKKRGFDEQD